MINYLFIIPSAYFFKSRFNSLKDYVFHAYFEWIPAILILIYAADNIFIGLEYFLIGFISFISIYEIGYLLNDLVSVKYENTPRNRFKWGKPSHYWLWLWISLRVIIFFGLSYWYDLLSVKLIGFYAFLLLVFALHNILRNKEYKVFTFFNLAFLRFVAPVFCFIPTGLLKSLIVPILIHYVLFRLLTYMDSKSLLKLTNRQDVGFRLFYSTMMLGFSTVLYLLTNDYIVIFTALYCWIFFLINCLYSFLLRRKK